MSVEKRQDSDYDQTVLGEVLKSVRLKNNTRPGMVVQAFDISIQETEAGRYVRSMPTWST